MKRLRGAGLNFRSVIVFPGAAMFIFPLHDRRVPGDRADIQIHARHFRRVEIQLLGFLRIQRFRVQPHPWIVGIYTIYTVKLPECFSNAVGVRAA